MEADSETVAEDATQETAVNALSTCRVCGHRNREGNKFCGACGLPLGTAPPQSPDLASHVAVTPNPGDVASPQTPLPAPESEDEVHPAPGAPAGTHHYHHHYHHHYFQGGNAEAGAAAPRANAPESAREADRMRVAAAAKGEPMSRSEAAVRRLTQEWVLACNTRQLDELIELYAPDAVVLRSNLPPIRGTMALREFFYSSLEAGLGEVAVDPMRVDVSGRSGSRSRTLQRAGSGNGGQTPRRAGQISLGLRQADERRLEAGFGMLVERPDAGRRGVGHSEGGCCFDKAAAAKKLASSCWLLAASFSRPAFPTHSATDPGFASGLCACRAWRRTPDLARGRR